MASATALILDAWQQTERVFSYYWKDGSREQEAALAAMQQAVVGPSPELEDAATELLRLARYYFTLGNSEQRAALATLAAAVD